MVKIQAWVCVLVVSLLSAGARAEGSQELDVGDVAVGGNPHDQELNGSTTLFVDIRNAGSEKICWRGTGGLSVYRPDMATLVGTLSGTAGGRCVNAVLGVTGAYYLDLLASKQTSGVEWDVSVCDVLVSDADCLNPNDAYDRVGRLWSTNWNFQTAETGFGQEDSANGSLYAVVPGGLDSLYAVIEMQMRGVAGYRYSLNANSIGPETVPGGVRVGRSVPLANHAADSVLHLYLNPPDGPYYNWQPPEITDVMLAPACGTSVVLGTAPGSIRFGSNVLGQYVVICDINQDSIYDLASSTDFSSFGDAVVGTNTVTWNGKNNAGTDAAPGTYQCVIRLNVGEFHYVANDIETAFPGIRMFRVESDRTTRTPVPMFWDDRLVGADTEGMFNGEISPLAPPPTGLNPGSYTDAPSAFYYGEGNTPIGNARAWGNFQTVNPGASLGSGKGNDTLLDQFAAADTATSPPFSISVIAGVGDADGDGLTNTRECQIGTDPQDDDSDGDGVPDGTEASASTAPNSDSDGAIDALDPDSDNDGVCDGAVTVADTCAMGPDTMPTVAGICLDTDGDGCNDCANGAYSPANDGLDTDGDGLCDTGDPDIDNDGVLNASDNCTSIANPTQTNVDGDPLGDACDPDIDGDGVLNAGDNCVSTANALQTNVDGDLLGDACDDSDLDGLVDLLDNCDTVVNPDQENADGDLEGDACDADDDDDGVVDAMDAAPLDRDACADTDMDGCDDCSVTDAPLTDPNNDGLDGDRDGQCNAGEDFDGDGVADVADLDDDNDGVLDSAENDQGLDPDADNDGDGVFNFVDRSDRGDGTAVACSGSGAQAHCDAPPALYDLDGDGQPNHLDLDSDDDGILDAVEQGFFALLGADGLLTGIGANGYADTLESAPESGEAARALLDTDGDGAIDSRDLDSDADGAWDSEEVTALAPLDANDDGVLDGTVDVDRDGLTDDLDLDDAQVGFPAPETDPRPDDDDGDDIPDPYDRDDASPGGGDSDADGRGDLVECPAPGWPCPDDDDGQPSYMTGAADQDAVPDAVDLDDDNDGILDIFETAGGLDPTADADADGVPNFRDADASACDDVAPADGLCDVLAPAFDQDADGLPNHQDLDSDGDGLLDAAESGNPAPDADRDGRVDGDVGANGVPDAAESGPDSGVVPAPVNTDGDALPDFLDVDADGDGVCDGALAVPTLCSAGPDVAPTLSVACRDLDTDGCDDCSGGMGPQPTDDGPDFDADGRCDGGDDDDDGDGAPDELDSDDMNRNVCRDSDADGCDDCSRGGFDPTMDGANLDGDMLCDAADEDDDGDGVGDIEDRAPMDLTVCLDADSDGCDDCSGGMGPLPREDGTDFDGDGACDLGDDDDDGDGIPDDMDVAATDPTRCLDADADGCDDCTGGMGARPAADGTDFDQDGACDLGDPDDDGDGVPDEMDGAPNDPRRCLDADMDGCDDCTLTGADMSGGNPMMDGVDFDADGACDLADPDLDVDRDGVPNDEDGDPEDPNVCRDEDDDSCDDCTRTGADLSGGNPDDDGPDHEGDGLCDPGDPDDDDDRRCDGPAPVPELCTSGPDADPNDPNVCGDTDLDGCDDCASGVFRPTDDGPDADGDGLCDRASDRDRDGIADDVDLDEDGDGILDVQETMLGVDPSGDEDGDGIANYRDADRRGDGMANDCPARAGVCETLSPSFDQDGDGLPNQWDLDADGDAIYDADESGHDAADATRDGIVDGPVGANGVADAVESPPDSGSVAAPVDTDGDDLPDFLDADTDADTKPDADEAGDADRATPPRDTDGDGTPDYRDPDDDGDGIPTRDELGPASSGGAEPDTDGDGVPNSLDPDDDGDGVPTSEERPGGAPRDTDGDGTPDHLDTDDDGDGVDTEVERGAGPEPIDTDGNGVPDFLDTDDDGDGVPTIDEPEDRDNDGVPDRLELPRRGTLAGGALCALRPTHSAGDALALLLFAFGALTLVSRRARRVPRAQRRRARWLPWLGAIALAAVLPGAARAQVALNRFSPAPLATDGFALGRPDVPGAFRYGAMLMLDYANDPLVYEVTVGESRGEERIVAHQLMLHLGLSLGIGKRGLLFVQLPVQAVMTGETPRLTSAPRNDGPGIGDVVFGLRLRLVGDRRSRFALSGELVSHLPSSRANREHVYSGNFVGAYEPALTAEVRAGRFDVRTRLGGRLRKREQVGNLELGHELLAGVGARLRLGTAFFLHAELYGSTFAPRFFRREESPLEGLLGFKYHGEALYMGAAAGPGLSRGYGSPDVRVLGTIGYAPHWNDADGDGVQDADDACPDEPEDRDGFEDGDGCPDPDNDGDGVPDSLDHCPNEPEDRDGDRDDDGCPDVDAAEAPADRDGDGVVDSLDACPDEPEDRDGDRDEDGCPEPDDAAPRLRCGKLESDIRFDLNVAAIRDDASPSLERAAALLREADARRVRIEGHADDRGTDPYNLALSRRRAEAVRRYFVEHGLEGARFETVGYGERRPVRPGTDEETRALNRRVELEVLELPGGCPP